VADCPYCAPDEPCALHLGPRDGNAVVTDPGREIAAALDAINRDDENERLRAQYRAAMKVLREIPSGTPDADLTDEQREAWRLHDEALRAVRL